MRAILTVARQDGTFPNVGTIGRVLYSGTRERIYRHARDLARVYDSPVRIELFLGETVYGSPATSEVIS